MDEHELTEGRDALIAGGWSLAVIAKSAKVSRGVAQRWRQGITRPNPDARVRLERAPYLIPAIAWERLAKSEQKPQTQSELVAALTAQAERPIVSVTIQESAQAAILKDLAGAEARAAVEVQLRAAQQTIQDCTQSVVEFDRVVCHSGYRAMRALLVATLECDARLHYEIQQALPEEKATGPIARLRETRTALEALHGALVAKSTEFMTLGRSLKEANALDKQANKAGKLLRAARLDAGNIERLFNGEVWQAIQDAACAVLRSDQEALEVAREELAALTDPFSIRLSQALYNVRTITFPCIELQKDPRKFCELILGIELEDVQVEIAENIRDYDRFACRSGHRIGKSWCLSAIMLWLYCCWTDARVFFTNATERQINEVNWIEIRRALANSGVCLSCKKKNKSLPSTQQHLRIMAPCPHSAIIDGKCSDRAQGGLHSNDFRQITGFTAKDAEATAGLAGENIFFLADEASGVKDQIFIAIEGNRAGGAKLALFGNPTVNDGEFYEAFYSKQLDEAAGTGFYKTMTVSSRSTRNCREGRVVVKGLATNDWCDEKLREWGADDAQYIVRVLGRHALGEDGRMCSVATIVAAEKRWLEVGEEGQLYIGCDPAGPSGVGDDSAFAARRGQKIINLRTRKGLDEDGHLAEVLDMIATYGTPGEPAIVNTDCEGLGAGIVARFRQYAVNNPRVIIVRAIRGSSIAQRSPLVYDRWRDELGGNFARWLRHGGAIPTDTMLAKELHALELKTFRTARGERSKLVSKEDLKKLLKRSPDRYDACSLAVWDQTGESEELQIPNESAREAREEGGGLDPYADNGIDAYA